MPAALTDPAPITSPVHCTEGDRCWAVFGIPTTYAEARARRLQSTWPRNRPRIQRRSA